MAPRSVRTALLAATTALLALLSAGLWFLGFRVHQWILGVDLGLALMLAATVALRRRAPWRRGRRGALVRGAVAVLVVSLAASLLAGAVRFARDGWDVLATVASDAPPATTGCGAFGLPGGDWDARARRRVIAAFPGDRVRIVQPCHRFVRGGDRVVRLRVGGITAPGVATELVIEEKVTFRDAPGLPPVVLAPYPDAAAAARDLPRLDATPGLVRLLGRRPRRCVLRESRVQVVPGWLLDCGLGRGDGPRYQGRVGLPRRH